MTKIWTSIRQHKNLFLFLGILFIFGVISGLLFYSKQDVGMKKTILISVENVFSHNVFDFKNVFIHLGSAWIIIASSFLFMGPALLMFFVFLEGVGVGFIIPILFSIYRWKFFLNFSIYFLLIKFVYLFFLFYLLSSLISFLKSYISYLKNKKMNFFQPLKKAFLISIFIALNDIVIYFLGNKLLIFLFG